MSIGASVKKAATVYLSADQCQRERMETVPSVSFQRPKNRASCAAHFSQETVPRALDGADRRELMPRHSRMAQQ